MLRRARPSHLVTHNPQRMILRAKSHNGLHKILPPGRIKPARANNQMLAPRLPNEFLPQRLAPPLSTHRLNRLARAIRPAPPPTENIIRAVMHQHDPALFANPCQMSPPNPV